MILVNTDYISGKDLEMLGMVKGSTIQTVNALRDIGADAVLIGETLMKAQDKRQKLTELRGCK